MKLDQNRALLRSNVAGITFPKITMGTPAALAAMVAQLEQTQWMPAAELRQHQQEQLLQMAAHSASESDYFAAVLQRAGLKAADLADEEKFRRLPVLRRRDIQMAGNTLHCKQVPAQHRPIAETKSSGSTGEPVVVRRSSVTQCFWMGMTLRDHAWHGRDFSKPFSAIRAQISVYEVRDNWGPPVNLLYESGPFQAIPIAVSLEQQWQWLSEFKPVGLLIYPTNLEGMAQFAQARGLSLPSLKQIRTVGETLRESTRKLAEEVLGAKVADCYSSQEVGSIAVQCPESGLYHICAENLIVEVLDAEGNPCRPGHSGKVVITDLVNFATPIIRYDIGDYAEVGPPCPCGRGLPTLVRVLGRERNLVVMPDGTRHWPIVGTLRFRDVAPINQFQFIQHDRELVEAKFVATQPVSREQEVKLAEMIHQCLGYKFTLKFTYLPDSIPRSRSGKFEEFVCNVTAAI